MRSNALQEWTGAQRRLHWWTAATVFLAFGLAWTMVGVPLRELLLKFLLFQIHKTLGILAFGFALSRLLIRARHGRPDWADDMPAWQQRAAIIVHAALYALLLATPAIGYFTAATAPAQVPTLFLGVVPIPHIVGTNSAWFAVLRQVHRGAAVLLVSLGCGHGIMAIHAHLGGQGTLVRMWQGRALKAGSREGIFRT